MPHETHIPRCIPLGYLGGYIYSSHSLSVSCWASWQQHGPGSPNQHRPHSDHCTETTSYIQHHTCYRETSYMLHYTCYREHHTCYIIHATGIHATSYLLQGNNIHATYMLQGHATSYMLQGNNIIITTSYMLHGNNDHATQEGCTVLRSMAHSKLFIVELDGVCSLEEVVKHNGRFLWL